jgi:hypothetical protein
MWVPGDAADKQQIRLLLRDSASVGMTIRAC